MTEINVTLSGVVSRGLRHMTAENAEMSLYITECILHNAKNAKWSFPAPACVRFSVRDMSGVTAKDRQALAVTGSSVKLHVVGNFNDYRIEVVSAAKYVGKDLESFLASLS